MVSKSFIPRNTPKTYQMILGTKIWNNTIVIYCGIKEYKITKYRMWYFLNAPVYFFSIGRIYPIFTLSEKLCSACIFFAFFRFLSPIRKSKSKRRASLITTLSSIIIRKYARINSFSISATPPFYMDYITKKRPCIAYLRKAAIFYEDVGFCPFCLF